MRKLLNLGAGVLVVSFIMGLAGCSEDDDDDVAGSVIGIWQLTETGVSQETFTFSENGNFAYIEADYVDQVCTTLSGDFTVAGDLLTVDFGVATNTVSWSQSGDNLTVVDPDPQDGGIYTYHRVAAMPTCADYGFAGDATPGHDNGLTGADGHVTFDMVDYSLDVSILYNGSPMNGVTVDVYQGTNLALVWASMAGYYGNFQLLNLGSLNGNQSITLELVDQAIEYLGWDLDPALFDLLYGDPGFTAHCTQGNLQALYNQANDWGEPFVFFRAFGDGAALREGNVAVGFDVENMSYDAFEEIAFSFFGYMPSDILDYCYYTLTIGGMTFTLPALHISDLTQQVEGDYQYKFIVTWGENPRDLDSHLFTPEIAGQSHHVYYGNSGSAEEAPFAWLDVDDTSSYGPEVVTIEALYPGTYQYAIYEYSGDQTLTESEAVVQVFRGRQLVGTYDIPTTPQAGDNWWWHVGDVDGATGNFTLVNTVTADSPAGGEFSPAEDMPAKMR